MVFYGDACESMKVALRVHLCHDSQKNVASCVLVRRKSEVHSIKGDGQIMNVLLECIYNELKDYLQI